MGVVLLGSPHASTVDGLRDGLKELGFEEGKQLALLVRDGKGDLKSVEAAARSLEGEKVDLIVAITTSVTLAVKRVTRSVPIVFYAGTDPVSTGLVESYRKPGGRFTGIAGQTTGLAGKRLDPRAHDPPIPADAGGRSHRVRNDGTRVNDALLERVDS